MSMMQRLVRAFETASNVELSDKDKGGMWGEQYAEYIIDDENNGCYIRNPIIPHPKKPGIFFETDFLVYMQGTLYCVEIKNYRGKVYYPARYRTVYVRKGWFIFKRTIQQTVFSHYDYSKMVQEKMGQNRERLTIREMPNPFQKTQRYIEDLKYYLYHIEPRLQSLPIYPVLGFAEKTDIAAIYNFDAGIMYISELPAFFAKYSDPAYARMPAPWIRQALHQLPTWDRILTTGNDWINGTIMDRVLSFKCVDGQKYNIPYTHIHVISLQREGNFSAYDTLTISYLNGSQQSFRCVNGDVHLRRFQGEQQTHKLRNVNQIVVGVANKMEPGS
jgi:Nuclease-related domain.